MDAIAESIEPSEETGRKPDIEAVLDVLEKISEGRELERKISNSSSFKYSKYSQTFETKATVSEGKVTEFFKGIPVWQNISEEIKDSVIKHYSEINELKASRLYYSLVKLAEWQPQPVFTTNYDVAIEKTYEEYVDCYPTSDDNRSLSLIDGFDRTKLTPEWSSLAYREYKPTGVDIIFFKLHGSVDWVGTPSGAIQRVASGQRNPGGMPTVIAYPSRLKREIHEEPFRTNYDYLLACLLHAKVCAIIGFSFRDQEIVEEFRQAMELNEKLKLVLIDPKAEAIEFHLYNKLGFKPKAELIKEEFTIENAQSIADRIAAKVKR